jgi:hypothetical protein
LSLKTSEFLEGNNIPYLFLVLLIFFREKRFCFYEKIVLFSMNPSKSLDLFGKSDYYLKGNYCSVKESGGPHVKTLF